MQSASRTTVTFESSAFNTTESKDYFINPSCFGDDLAKWLICEFKRQGLSVDDEPGQEDFGWYFNFTVDGVDYCFILGYRPSDNEVDPGTWIGWLERKKGFLASVFGARKRGIGLNSALAIHSVLVREDRVSNVLWHRAPEFNKGREENGVPDPAVA